jgi:organic hydroperoxide reductase OsmC/OhrA
MEGRLGRGFDFDAREAIGYCGAMNRSDGWTDEVHAVISGSGRAAEGDVQWEHGRVRVGFSKALGGPAEAMTGTPEHLLAASAASCWLLTFADAAERMRLEVVRLEARARVIVERDGAGYRVAAIEVRPEIVVRREGDALGAKVARACDIAGRYCIVEKALRSGVARYEVTPVVAYE